MKPTQSRFRYVKTAAHAATLVFSLFWLVATSSQIAPAQECFTGLSNPTKIAVVLGTPASDQSTQTGTVSCGGIDGLAPGSTLTFTLSRGSRPSSGAAKCWSYDTQAVEGPTGVRLVLQHGSDVYDLTYAVGNFTSATATGCQGSWVVTLGPPAMPQEGHPISPIDTASTWTVGRVMNIDAAQSCGGAFTGSGPITCSDIFSVVSITQVGP